MVGSGAQIPATGGGVFWVDSGHTRAASTNPGSYDFPMATIDQAVGRCTANNGDVILVAPGHAENLSGATSLVVDIAGVQIIGLGHGRNRPVLTYTNAAGTIEMDAANTRLSNVVLVSSVTAVLTGINVDAADVTLDNIEVDYDETGDDFVQIVDADTVDRLRVINCNFIVEEGAGCDQAIRLDTVNDARILNNHFSGDFTDAAIVGEGALGTGIVIKGNTIYNSDTTAGRGIRLTVACTGSIAHNDLSTAAAVAPDTVLDPGSCGCVENYASTGTDSNAVPVPVTGIAPWRVVKHVSTAFDGATGDAHGNDGGALDPYSVFTVTGDVEAKVVGIVNTTLVGAATLEVGVAGNTAQFIAQIADATGLVDGDVWTDGGAEAGADVWPEEAQIVNDGANIIETVGTANVTAGQIDYYCLWRPLEAGALIVSA